MTIAPPTQRRLRARPSAKDVVYDWFQHQTWTEETYLALASASNYLIELSDGRLVIHPMPTPEHQRIVRELYDRLSAWVKAQRGGEVLFAPMPIRLWPGKFREPDIVFFLNEHRDRIAKQYGGPPDLAVEVFSPSTEDLDVSEKFVEYAQAGVSEYWQVDPTARTIYVFTLRDRHYAQFGRFGPGQQLNSALLPSFTLLTDEIFAPVEA